MTDPLGQSQVLPYLQHLAKKGYQLTILSFEKKERFLKEASIVREIITAACITWVPLLFTARPPILSKVYDRYQMKKTAIALQHQNNFDLVHCRSYIAAEIGLILKAKFGVKMLFDMRGFWADEKVDNGQWNLQKPLYKYIYKFYKKKERDFLLKADGIVSLTQAAKDHLLERSDYNHLSIKVVPCCADLDHFDYNDITPEDIVQKKAVLKIPSISKVMTYLGSVGGWYMTKEMFRLFALLQQKEPEWVMLFLTKDDPELIKKDAAAAGIPSDKIFITYSNRKELPHYLAMSNCSLFFIKNTFSKKASSPTKHAELMGMGIPVICNNIGDTGNIIFSTKTGLVINEFDDDCLNKAIANIATIEKIDKTYIRQCAKEIFDLQNGVQKYSALYARILNESPVAVT
jgi:glycosyltransferase involved in cell wall biosynthesis